MPTILSDLAAFERIGGADIAALTEAATRATFYADGLTEEQRSANARIVAISAATCIAAAASAHQRFSAAFLGDRFAGYMIATRHAADDLELDWMMVDPACHGSGVAPALMRAGIDFLGEGKPMWLNVICHNARAIAFYRKFGFEVDPGATTAHVVPHLIMRRAA